MDGTEISTKQGNRIKQKSCWFNGTTKLVEDIEKIKSNIVQFPFYAYIMHKPDKDDDNLHIHFLIYSRSSLRIKDVAETLDVDYGEVQKTKVYKVYAKYMLHKGWDDKEQYSLSDIVTNDSDRFSYFISENFTSSGNLFNDFCDLKSGRISRIDFVDKYKGELSQLNFYQKLRVFSEIDHIAKF